MSVIIKLLSKFDDSGLKKAKSGFSGLTKAVGALGIGIGITQLTSGLLDAAKAASADAKSTQLLNSQLVKNASATAAQIAQNDLFINSLSNQVGILDDDLRPAQARLARVTGSVAKSQDLLKLALDASAVSGKPLSKVSQDIAKAFVGNTSALEKLFPKLKGSKDLFADLAEVVGGAAAAQASPFDKINVAMDNLKEKLGGLVLPAITDFIDALLKPGGAIDQAEAFFDAVGNPKTDVGKAFENIKESVGKVSENVVALFALMDTSGSNNPMKGFANFMQGISDIIGGISDGLTVIGGSISKLFSGDFGGFLDLMNAEVTLGAESIRRNMSVQDTINSINAKTLSTGKGSLYTGDGYENNNVSIASPNLKVPKTPSFILPKGAGQTTNNVTINVQGADPKATVDALGKYLKQNGTLPFKLGTAGR